MPSKNLWYHLSYLSAELLLDAGADRTEGEYPKATDDGFGDFANGVSAGVSMASAFEFLLLPGRESR